MQLAFIVIPPSGYLTEFRGSSAKTRTQLAIKLTLAGFQDLPEIHFNSEYENLHGMRWSASKGQLQPSEANTKGKANGTLILGSQTRKETDRGRGTK